MEVRIKVEVDKTTAGPLNSGDDTLEDILVLHLENGKDYYISFIVYRYVTYYIPYIILQYVFYRLTGYITETDNNQFLFCLIIGIEAKWKSEKKKKKNNG